MKFICAADLHITAKVPENRKGDYFGQAINKFAELIRITKKHSDENLLVVAGDFFDSAKVPYKVVRLIIEMLLKSDIRVLAVPGQHDQRWHGADLDNTPIGLLATCKLVTILKPFSKVVIKKTSFMGAGWGEEPEIEADVVLLHRMITKKGELWPGQTNYSSAHAIMRKYPWAKAIISGDNHAPHALTIKNNKNMRLQINCGSMMRSTKSQIGYQPRSYVVDTADWTLKAVKIPCLSDKEVFDFGKIAIAEMKDESKKVAEERISKFIDSLPKNEKERPEFKTILNSIVTQIKPKDAVKSIIEATMERVS